MKFLIHLFSLMLLSSHLSAMENVNKPEQKTNHEKPVRSTMSFEDMDKALHNLRPIPFKYEEDKPKNQFGLIFEEITPANGKKHPLSEEELRVAREVYAIIHPHETAVNSCAEKTFSQWSKYYQEHYHTAIPHWYYFYKLAKCKCELQLKSKNK